jgi:hypothetical protein
MIPVIGGDYVQVHLRTLMAGETDEANLSLFAPVAGLR